MNLRISAFLAAPAMLVSILTAQQAIPKSYKDIKYPPLNPVKVPRIERYTLPNGIRVLLVEDHELPTFAAQAFIPGGEFRDPAGKTGLAGITLAAMRTGGSVTQPGDALDKELDRLPASVETDSGDDANTASVSCLRENAARMLGVLADLIRNPAFPQDKIDLAKTQTRAGIERRNDDVTGILGREMTRLLYGKESAFGREEEYATIDAIAREDVLAYYKDNFQPDNILLGVWGDFDTAAMKAIVEKHLGSWARGGKARPKTPAVDMAAQAKGIFVADKSDVTQSWVRAGHLLDLKRNHPDYPAMIVLGSVLGGGFGSRMFDEIRTRQGLAYSASAGYSAQFDHPGMWSASAGVENKNVPKAVDAVKAEIRKIKEAEITDAELQRAKDSYLKGDAFNYDSTGKIIGRQLVYEYYGYPRDQLEKINAGVAKVTRADVLRVAKKYIDESKFAILAVGNVADFKDGLAAMGKVTQLDIEIPQPKMAPAPGGSAGDADKAKALLTKARQAHGGAVLDTVENYLARVDMTIVSPQGEFASKAEGLVSLAGKSRNIIEMPFGKIVQVFDGSAIWMKGPQGVQQMPANFVNDARSTALRETIALLRNWDKPGYRVQALGSSKVDNRDLEGVLISNDTANFQVKVFLDPQSGVLAAKSFQAQGVETTEILSDVRDAGGVKLPHRVVRMANGKKVAESRIQELKINPGAPDSAFSKPE